MDWHLTDDVDEFFARAGGFLRSRPARHTMHLTRLEKARAPGGKVPVLGWLDDGDAVAATYYRFPSRALNVTALNPAQADALAAHLVDALPAVNADHETAATFAEVWQRRTGARAVLRLRLHLYRLGALTLPEPFPAGRGRPAGARDHEHVVRWCREFAADVGEDVTIEAASWAGTRFAEKRYTFWEAPDGTAVSMAGVNPMVAGQARVDPVYTPAHQRGRGYAAAVTVEVSRAALAAGATDVVLFTDPGNPTSNALYRRLGYEHLTDFAVYDFTAT